MPRMQERLSVAVKPPSILAYKTGQVNYCSWMLAAQCIRKRLNLITVVMATLDGARIISKSNSISKENRLHCLTSKSRRRL